MPKKVKRSAKNMKPPKNAEFSALSDNAAFSPSFMNAPLPKELAETEIAIFGIPFDQSTSFRPGARFGPRAVRDFSPHIGLYGRVELWPREYDIREKYKTRDYGDVSCPPGDPERMVENAEKMARLSLSAGASILMLGGDHFTTYPVLRACFEHYGPLSLVHFDAHTDDFPIHPRHHGAQFYRSAKEGLIDPARSIHVGARTSYKHSIKLGYEVLDGVFVHEHTAEEIGAAIRKRVQKSQTYLSFDIDFVDPGFAPGTGSPVIGGPDTFKTRAILRNIEGLNVIGGDVVEVSPPYDSPSQITALTGATIASDILYILGTARERFK